MLNEKLLQLKKQSSMTAQEISQKSGIPLATVHKLLSGETKNPKYNTLKAFINALEHELTIEPAGHNTPSALSEADRKLLANYQLLSEEGQKLVAGLLTALNAYEEKKTAPISPEAYRELPLYLLPASAGVGSYLDSDQYEFKPFPASSVPPKAKYAIRVTGDSMEPAYYQDDLVFVEPVRQLAPGEVGIIVINGEAFIKQYRENAFISFNPQYGSIIPGEFDTIRIIGKVVGRYSS